MKKAEFYAAVLNADGKPAVIKQSGYSDGTYYYYKGGRRWFAIDPETGISVNPTGKDYGSLDELQKAVSTSQHKAIIKKAKSSFDFSKGFYKDLRDKMNEARGESKPVQKIKDKGATPMKKTTKTAAKPQTKKSAKLKAKARKTEVRKPKRNPFNGADDVYLTKNKIAVTRVQTAKAARGYKTTTQTKYYVQDERNMRALKSSQGDVVRVGRTGTNYKRI